MHPTRILLFIGFVVVCLYSQASGNPNEVEDIIVQNGLLVLKELLKEKLPPPRLPPKKKHQFDKFLPNSGVIELAKDILGEELQNGELNLEVPEVKTVLKGAATVMNKFVALLDSLGLKYPSSKPFALPVVTEAQKVLKQIEAVTFDKDDVVKVLNELIKE